MRHAGIDEAGYGPTLGPLAIGCAIVEGGPVAELERAFADTGVGDSKKIHDPRTLAPLEMVALPAIAWLTGFMPDTAADVFAVLGESATLRNGTPWMEEATTVRLPVAATALPTWRIPTVTPVGLTGALIQPRAYNAFLRSRAGNKADLEWQSIGRLLADAHTSTAAQRTVVDRLGGRKFYRDLLQTTFPNDLVLVVEETSHVSRYTLVREAHADRDIGFHVGGESCSPLTAIASCVAKYARELHMLMLNRYWTGRMSWLTPTAGYPQDAKRWLHQVGTGYVDAWSDDLVRTIADEKV